MLIVVARQLGKTGFGTFGIIQSTITTVGTICSFAVGLTATRFVAQLWLHDPVRAGRVIALTFLVAGSIGAAISLLLFALAVPIATYALADPDIAPLLRVSSAGLLFLCMSGAQTGALAGFEAFRSIATINSVSALASVPLTIGLAFARGVPGAVVGVTVSAVLNCVAGHVALRRTLAAKSITIGVAGCLAETRLLYTFSAPVALTGLLSAPVAWVANAIIVHLPSGYSELGLFNAANTFRAALLFLPTTMQNACFPAMASAYAQRGTEYRRAVCLAHNYASVPSAMCAVMCMFIAPMLVGAFGSEFHGATLVLQILMLSVAIQAVGTALGATIQVRGQVWGGFALNMLWALMLLGVTQISARSLGAIGLALANSVAYAVLLGCQLMWQRPHLDPRLPWVLGRTILLAVVAGVGAHACAGLRPAILFLLGVLSAASVGKALFIRA